MRLLFTFHFGLNCNDRLGDVDDIILLFFVWLEMFLKILDLWSFGADSQNNSWYGWSDFLGLSLNLL